MDSILDRLDFYENPKCAIWHANVTQVVSFLHILARLPQKLKIASHASAVKLYLVRPYPGSVMGRSRKSTTASVNLDLENIISDSKSSFFSVPTMY